MNEVIIADQTKVFLLSLACGAFLCAVYDLFRVLRKTVLKNKLAVFFTDIVYWFIVTCATVYITLIYCGGYVRGYVLVGISLGFIIFRLLLSPLCFKLIYIVFKLIKNAIRVLLIPLTALARLLNLLTNKLYGAVFSLFMWVKTRFLQKKSLPRSKKA